MEKELKLLKKKNIKKIYYKMKKIYRKFKIAFLNFNDKLYIFVLTQKLKLIVLTQKLKLIVLRSKKLRGKLLQGIPLGSVLISEKEKLNKQRELELSWEKFFTLQPKSRDLPHYTDSTKSTISFGESTEKVNLKELVKSGTTSREIDSIYKPFNLESDVCLYRYQVKAYNDKSVFACTLSDEYEESIAEETVLNELVTEKSNLEAEGFALKNKVTDRFTNVFDTAAEIECSDESFQQIRENLEQAEEIGQYFIDLVVLLLGA